MKKISPQTVIGVISVTLFALMLVDSYLDHRDEITESISRLKSVLNGADNA